MIELRTNILILVFLLLALQGFSQYSGGNADGSAFDGDTLTLNQQDFYCYGGTGDGFAYDGDTSTLNQQYFYCYGGDSDGVGFENETTTLNEQVFYCSGGNSDGFGTETSSQAPMVDQLFYCSGGINDGHSMAFALGTVNEQYAYCIGGNADGYNMASFKDVINTQYYYCTGGVSDGYAMHSRLLTMNNQNEYCLGGIGDGFTSDDCISTIYGEPVFTFGGISDGFAMNNYNGSIYGPSMFCFGGNGDGYSLGSGATIPLGIGIWTGLTNTEWNTNTNWVHDIVPVATTAVTIPGGCPNYPIVPSTISIDTLLGMIDIKRLDILEGASFDHTRWLFVNGILNIAGSYTATVVSNNQHRIYKRGELNISSTGSMIIGNQTPPSMGADMVIYDGGVVTMEGGYLGIDDKLWLQAGGTLSMTSGEIFVNTLGTGSGISSFNPGFFYVEAGALGGISGGVFRICGNDNPNPPYIPPYSMVINEPDFDFSGTSTLCIQHGGFGTEYNTGLELVDGVEFQNVIINKAHRTVIFRGNTTIHGDLIIEPDCTLEIESGFTINVGP